MIVKLLTEHHLEFRSLKGGCRGSSESAYVKLPHHAMAHLIVFNYCLQMFRIKTLPTECITKTGAMGVIKSCPNQLLMKPKMLKKGFSCFQTLRCFMLKCQQPLALLPCSVRLGTKQVLLVQDQIVQTFILIFFFLGKHVSFLF